MVFTDHLGVSKVITNMLTSKACLYMVSYRSMATVSFKIEGIVENWAPALSCQCSTTEVWPPEHWKLTWLPAFLFHLICQICLYLQLRPMFKSRFRLFMKSLVTHMLLPWQYTLLFIGTKPDAEVIFNVCGVCRLFGCVLSECQLTHCLYKVGAILQIKYWHICLDVTVSLRINLFTLIVVPVIVWNSIVDYH